MGQGFTIKCEKCGTENSYLQGIGFMYYSFLERTKEDVIKAKFGKDILNCRVELMEKEKKTGYILKDDNIIALIGYRE